MTRASNTPVTHRRRKSVIKRAEGYFGSKHKLFKTAKEQLMKSGQYAFRDRKRKKRDFRRIWILRINNACRKNGLNYSVFMRMLTLSNVVINRKHLSEISVSSPENFSKLVSEIKIDCSSLENKTPSVV